MVSSTLPYLMSHTQGMVNSLFWPKGRYICECLSHLSSVCIEAPSPHPFSPSLTQERGGRAAQGALGGQPQGTGRCVREGQGGELLVDNPKAQVGVGEGG